MALERTLSRRTKILYGSGDVGFSLTSTIIGAYLAIFLTDVVGLSPGLAAISILIGKSWDWINDPIIGHISDRTRTRWGRRRPFLLFGWLPFALAFTLLWWRPPFDNTVALVLYYAVAYVVYDAAATFVYMPYFALTPELSADYDERTSLTTYRMFFSIFGSLVSFTVPLMIVGSFEPANAPKVLMMGLLFGIVSALPLLLVFFGTRERQDHIELAQPSLRESLQSARRNPPFLYGLGLFLAAWIAVAIVQANLLFYIKYWLNREGDSDTIMAAIFITAMLALPIWQVVSERWSKRWAYIGGVAFWAVVQIVLVLVGPATGMTFILILCVLAGVGVAAVHVLPWAMIPDATEYDEWLTGERHEGMYYSLTTLVHKVAASIAIPLSLLVLEFTGYVPNSSQQPASALTGIRLVMGPLPALLLCLGIVIALRYPLDRAQYKRILRELALRKAGEPG
ncbi:MAG: MFS transporter [Anaerolineae bacterium]|nr:MFS transporter [Anaerolineae bacterium]